jgi:hypothetical protein
MTHTASIDDRPARTLDSSSPTLPTLPLIAGVLAALLLLVLLGLQGMAPAAPAPATAPAGAFSAARAMTHVARIAAAPHPSGTAAHAEVRHYLVQELRRMGLATQVQEGFAIAASGETAGRVHNIVARLPGSGAGPALLLAAHYDSVPHSFGAADDGAGVASILETVRALQAGAALRNDVLVLLTDGEEIGLLGAEAFVADPRWKARVGLALNFEFRGNAGPVMMFETSQGNGKLVQAFANVERPVGNSLLAEIYKVLPNDTDLSAFKRAGLMGMNFAGIERPSAYHTQLDGVAQLDQHSVQHQGETMLALARHFGNADLAQLKDGDRVYFTLPVVGLVSYPAALGWGFAAAAALLFGFALRAGLRAAGLRAGRVLAAAGLLPLLGLGAAILCTVTWLLVSMVHYQYRALMDVYNVAWYWAAFSCLALALFGLVLARLLHSFRVMEVAMGAALLWLGLLLASMLWMPGASFLFTWPLLPLLAAYAWLLAGRGAQRPAAVRAAVLLPAAAPAILLLAPLVLTLFAALTTRLSAVPVFLMVLAFGLGAPLLAIVTRRFVFPLLPGVAAAALLVAGSATSAVSPVQPHPTNLVYAVDGMTGNAMWLSSDPMLDPWAKGVMGDKPENRKVPEIFGDHPQTYWTAAAPDAGVQAPQVEVLQDRVDGGARHVRINVRSARSAPEIKVYVEGLEVQGAHIGSRQLLRAPASDWAFAAYALGQEGLELGLKLPVGKPFTLRVIDRTYGLPPQVPKRQADAIIQPFGNSDSMRAVTAIAFK